MRLNRECFKRFTKKLGDNYKNKMQKYKRLFIIKNPKSIMYINGNLNVLHISQFGHKYVS